MTDPYTDFAAIEARVATGKVTFPLQAEMDLICAKLRQTVDRGERTRLKGLLLGLGCTSLPQSHGWNLIKAFSDGHSFFSRLALQGEDDKIYIADQSGKFPDTTRDGLLCLDMTENLQAGDRCLIIPLLTMTNHKTSTPCSIIEGLWVAAYFDRKIDYCDTTDFAVSFC